MDLLFAGEVAVVFGAARWIGQDREVAAIFAGEGTRVVLRNVPAFERTTRNHFPCHAKLLRQRRR
jgi:NAD(P)-dependent dehydrogenase (short-subunit alcohol dehydrogenase family)